MHFPRYLARHLAAAAFLLATCPNGVAASTEVAPIVKLAAAPQIDGKVDDWPFPATIHWKSADGGAEMRLGYDDRFLYVATAVTDASPWKNNPSRAEEAIKGGDAVALYFQTRNGDQQRVLISRGSQGPLVYVYREHSTQKKPYTFASPVGEAPFDFAGPLDGAKAAVQTSATGYVLEAALPWQALGLRAASFKFDAQIIFSDPAGTTNVGAAWWHASEGPGLTVEDLPTEARLYPDTWGQAALVNKPPAISPAAVTAAAAPSSRTAPGSGGNTIHLDLPRAGKLSVLITDKDGWILRELVAAKKYERGPQQIAWDGRDRYGEPLPPGTYQWKALLFDGMGVKFMGSVGSSGRPPYRTPDGLGGIGGQHGAYKSIAEDEGGIYMAGSLQEGPPAMRKINPKDGKALWKRAAGGFQAIKAVAAAEKLACVINVGGRAPKFTVDLIRINPETGQDEPMGSAKATRTLDVKADTRDVGALAIAGGRAWISVPAENRLISVDLHTGELGPAYQLPAPTGLARLDEHHLLVCVTGEVVSLDLTNGEKRSKLKVAAPRAVAVAPDGKIYVSDLGDSQQIRVFSAGGQALAVWGRPGGKPTSMPKYDPLAFREIIGITVGPDGNVWVGENWQTPNRFVKLSPEGKWLEDFYGPVAYNTFGPDMDDLSTVFYTPGGRNNPELVETKLDYDKYAAHPDDPVAGWSVKAIYDLALSADGVTRNEMIAQIGACGYGHVFAFKGTNGERYLFRLSKANRGASPVGAGIWIWKTDRWVPSAIISAAKEQPSWADENGDGLVQPEETYVSDPIMRYAWISPDLTLDGDDGQVSVANITKAGAPSYKGAKFAPYLLPAATADDVLPNGGYTFVSREVDGAVYYVSNTGPHRHLSFWDRATENRLTKVAGGRVQWIVGQHLPKPVDTEFSTLSGVAGVIGDVVLTHIVEPANYPAFTTDGFALGNAMVDETGARPSVGPEVINIESFTGLFVKDPKTGKRMLFCVSSGDDRILEVTGPGQTTPLQGSVELKQVAARESALVIPYSTWYSNGQFAFGADGDDDEWQPDVPRYPLLRNGQVVGDVRLRRDAGALHVFASLLDTNPAPASRGIQLVLSRQADGANGVTLDLTAAPAAKGQWTAAATLRRGPQQVIATSDTKVTGHKGAPRAAASDLKAGALGRWRGLGYRVEAEIPLSLLPEFSAPVAQTFKRPGKNGETGKAVLQTLTDTLPDLTAPLYMGVALLDGAAAAPQKLVAAQLPAPEAPQKKGKKRAAPAPPPSTDSAAPTQDPD